MDLAGRQVRARVELEDLSQEVYVRAVAHADSRAPSTASPTKTRGRPDG